MSEERTEETRATDAMLDASRDDAIRVLRELIAIPSVGAPAEDGAPFGPGVRDAFDYMLNMAARDGFTVLNADNFGGHIEFPPEAFDTPPEETVGVLCHLDVVPAGGGWSCDPFAGKVEDGRIYGRGATDDKGPTVACYFAMKALLESGFRPARRIRLILGLDEETGWVGMARYLERVPPPQLGFTPDANFPVIHGEKGILIFELAKKTEKAKGKGLELRRLGGGDAPNMVAASARAVIRGDDYDELREKVAAYRERTGRDLSIRGMGKSVEVTAKGVSAHGATPQLGVNAISVLMEFLGEISFTNEDASEFIAFYNEHIGFDLHGERMGCDFADDASGRLIFNVGRLSGDSEAILLTVNVRYPVTSDAEAVYDAMLPLIHAHDLGLVKQDHKKPIYVPESDPLVETLMRVYRARTGDSESRPLVIGGGTYARAARGLVAFGASFPGDPETAHQKDEHISIENFARMTHIYADAMRALSEGDAARR